MRQRTDGSGETISTLTVWARAADRAELTDVSASVVGAPAAAEAAVAGTAELDEPIALEGPGCFSRLSTPCREASLRNSGCAPN